MSKSNRVFESGGLLREKAWDIIYTLTLLFRFITLQSFFAGRREGRAKVTIRDITSTQCEKLTAAGIAFTIAKGPISSDQRGNIALENRCLSAALLALGLSELYRVDGEQGAEIVTIDSDEAVADSKRLTIVGLVSAGTKDRLSYLKTKNRNAAHPLVLVEKQKGLARLIAARLRPVFPGKIAVHIDGPAEKNGSGLAADTQHIFISSAVFDTPATLCGIAVNARSKSSYAHTVRGVWITDPVNHYGIGEYFGNYLYFFAGLNTAKNPRDSMRLFENIALEMVEQIDVERLAARAVEHALAVEASLGFSTGEVDGPAVEDVQVSGLNDRSGRLVGRLTAALLGPVLGPEQGKSLAVIHGAKQPRPLASDGKFRIFYDAYRLGGTTVKPPGRFWGWPVPAGENVYEPSGAGRIICDENGFPIAELNGDNLYILLDLVKYGSRLEALLFTRFLTEVRMLLKMRRQDSLFAHDQAIFAAQAKHLLQDSAAYLKSLGDDTGKLSEAVRAGSEALSKEIVRARRLQRVYYQLYDSPGLELGAEFDQMLKVRKVLDVRVTDTSMTVVTDLIYCVNPLTKKTHEIGAFEITFPFDSAKHIHWRNLTRLVHGHEKGFNAPHVNAKGYACLGNVKEAFPKLLANREYSTALQLAIAFLESVDPKDTWGKHIGNWPVAHGTA
jgi:hypothetical protein